MTEYHYFTGKCKWARLVNPDEKYDRWSICLFMDKPSTRAYDKSGIQLSMKTDDDGEYVTFARPREKKFGSEIKTFDPPNVIGPGGEKDFDGRSIGNGSTVTVKVISYDTKKGKGHRLEAVRVDELVKYERDGYDF